MIPRSLHWNPISISLHEMTVQVTMLLLAVEVWSPQFPSHWRISLAKYSPVIFTNVLVNLIIVGM